MRITSLTYVHRKSYTVRNFIFFFIILILVAALLIAAISAYAGWKLCHPKRLSIPAFSANIVPKYDDVSFKDIKGELALKGWYFEVKGSRKTIILAHGYAKNRLQFGEETIHIIKSFLDEGYNVLTFDFRNCGESEGNITTVGLKEKDDLLGAVEYAKNKGSEKIVLMGFSMGASTSILVAAENKDVDAVIADSPFSDLTHYLEENINVWSKLPSIPFNQTTLLAIKMLTGIDTKKVSPQKVITLVSPTPVLLIHSKDDNKIPYTNSQSLLEGYYKANVKGSNTGSAHLWETIGVGHVGSYRSYPEEYIKRVIDFLNETDIRRENKQEKSEEGST